VKMKVLVTGGAGFIGRWVVKRFLDNGDNVIAIDNFSNGCRRNVSEFKENFELIEGDICNKNLIEGAVEKVDLVLHLAAQIEVQDSLDRPEKSFTNNILGTFLTLEACRKHNKKFCIVGTCMVYDIASGEPISEKHPTKPASPYAATKLAAEELAISYFYSYNLPVVIVRPFNTYGPFQKTNMEGGVVSIFIKQFLKGENLKIFGDGTQTRDLLFVEDCADFIFKASTDNNAIGQIFNAGTGQDISINGLAKLICPDDSRIKHIEHHHPQSEVSKLLCDSNKTRELLGWRPMHTLKEGIEKTKEWVEANET